MATFVFLNKFSPYDSTSESVCVNLDRAILITPRVDPDDSEFVCGSRICFGLGWFEDFHQTPEQIYESISVSNAFTRSV